MRSCDRVTSHEGPAVHLKEGRDVIFFTGHQREKNHKQRKCQRLARWDFTVCKRKNLHIAMVHCQHFWTTAFILLKFVMETQLLCCSEKEPSSILTFLNLVFRPRRNGMDGVRMKRKNEDRRKDGKTKKTVTEYLPVFKGKSWKHVSWQKKSTWRINFLLTNLAIGKQEGKSGVCVCMCVCECWGVY